MGPESFPQRVYCLSTMEFRGLIYGVKVQAAIIPVT